MYTSFYINDNRLNDVKSFIRNKLPTARFRHNPIKSGEKWFMALTMTVGDGNKLNQYLDKIDQEDSQQVKVIKFNFIKLWYIRIFKVITIARAQELGLKHDSNVHGDAINQLNCRSIWVDDKGRSYRVSELFEKQK